MGPVRSSSNITTTPGWENAVSLRSRAPHCFYNTVNETVSQNIFFTSAFILLFILFLYILYYTCLLSLQVLILFWMKLNLNILVSFKSVVFNILISPSFHSTVNVSLYTLVQRHPNLSHSIASILDSSSKLPSISLHAFLFCTLYQSVQLLFLQYLLFLQLL